MGTLQPPIDKTTGWTLVLTLVLGLGLSLAPLPDALRPLPSLAQGPVGPRLLALVTTSSAASRRQSVGVSPDGEKSGDAVEVPILPEEEETPAVVATPSGEVRPEPAKPVNVATLGLEDLGPAARTAALELEALREKMGAQHVDLEPGCRRMGASGCEESGLAPFFAALEALRDGRRTLPVRAVTLGDSLIASDHITDVVRLRLQERHGSGGKGLLYIDRPTRSGRGVRAGSASPGWEITRIIDKAPPKERLGMTGVAFSTPPGSSQDVRYALDGATVGELWFLAQPNGGSVQLSVDGKPLQRIQTRWTNPEVAFSRVKLPPGGKSLTLRTRGKVELHAVSLESGTPGVVADTIGLPGAYAGVFTRAHRPFFRTQLRQRKPSLVVLMLGGNEAFRLGREWTKPEDIRQEAKGLVEWVRDAVPGSACLVVSPIDAAVRTMGGDLVPRRGSRQVADIFREAAREGGCAYWDALSAMGGEGAAARWLAAGLLHEDLIHPRAKGSDLLGHLFDLSLQRAFDSSRAPRVADVPGLHNPTKALAHTFARLQEREQGKPVRVGLLHLGASPDDFTEAVRASLVKRFGEGGRGFVALSQPTAKAPGATLELTGPWQVEDALQAPAGQAWSLAGARAVGAPEASLRLRFCEGCAASSTPARLSLAWLDGPGTARMEVRVDGTEAPPEPPPPEPFTAPTVRLRSFPVSGQAHTLEVRNLGGGTLTVLGAALDVEQPGLVYDAVGLPGATAFTLRDMDPQALAAQLSARKPQLLVLGYGAAESERTDLDAETLRRDYGALIARLRADAGGAECLLLGPPDRLRQREDGSWTEAPGLATVLAVLPEVAREQGCAYWSARAAMGGERSLLRWQRTGLSEADGTRLTSAGQERLAASFLLDLLQAYESFKSRPAELAAEGG
jgi:lysophospholipase L1-like esterase